MRFVALQPLPIKAGWQPTHVVNPNTVDPTAVDPKERPVRPALFITDITANAQSRIGDWEYGGQAYDVSEVFGTWKGLQGQGPIPNGTNLGEGSVELPVAPKNEFTAELRWNLTDARFGLVKGHTYRLEFMFHDGDRTADTAEKCANITYRCRACFLWSLVIGNVEGFDELNKIVHDCRIVIRVLEHYVTDRGKNSKIVDIRGFALLTCMGYIWIV